MPDNRGNLQRHRTFREAVELTMRLGGLEAARAVPTSPRRPLSEFEDAPRDRGHISGIDGWSFGVHADVRQARLGPHVDAAEQMATLAGVDRYAVVAYRASHPAAEALAVMPLSQLVEIICELQGARP